ncbi:MAG: 4'-phosphopantetheinyl transferase superfamily protein [Clostridia bacterium]|nr:4'-phosphopantetheinyl transferase superfamily protein [Clostridia bacterium]
MNTVTVYIAKISPDVRTELPCYINTADITNPNVLAEKHSAYSLLYRGVKEEYGINMDVSLLTRSENGKPEYPDICFSISHTKGLCAVALSPCEVGVDIEEEINTQRAERIRKNVLHQNESPNADITELWTKKEAIFKLSGGKAFIASDIDTAAYNTDTYKYTYDGKSYTVSVATDGECEIKVKTVDL